MGALELLRRAVQEAFGGVAVGEAPPRDPQQVGHGEQALLGAVVEIAPHAAAFGVGRLHDAGARGGELGRLGAPLQLGGGAGGEDPQRRHVLLGDLHARPVEHGQVAEVAPVGARRHTAR